MKRTGIAKSKQKQSGRSGVFILFIGDEGAILTYQENNAVVRRLYAESPESKSAAAFSDLLRTRPRAPIYVLVDLMEQAYVRHTLPPVSALGAKKIVERRLARDFAAEDLKSAMSLGKEKTGKKEWNYLLIALPYSGVLKGWCELLAELPNRLKGVYLLPVESEPIIHALNAALTKLSGTATQPGGAKKRLKNVAATKNQGSTDTASADNTVWDVMVVHNKTGGFRQVVLKDGRLVFTRMAQSVFDENPEMLAGNIEQEVRNTIEYLKRLSFREDAQLRILFIVNSDIKLHLSTDMFNASTAHALTPYEAAELIGLTNCVLSGDSYADVFLSCAFLKKGKRKVRLLPDSARELERYYHGILGIKVTGGVAATILLGMGGVSAYNAFGHISKTSKLQEENEALQQQVSQLQQEAEGFDVAPAKIDTLIRIHNAYTTAFPGFDSIVSATGNKLADELAANTFSWEMAEASQDNNSRRTRRTQSEKQNPLQNKEVTASIGMEVVISPGGKPQMLQRLEAMRQAIEDELESYQVQLSGLGEADENRPVSINYGVEEQDEIVPITLTFSESEKEESNSSGGNR